MIIIIIKGFYCITLKETIHACKYQKDKTDGRGKYRL